jgi:hypothetical protein
VLKTVAAPPPPRGVARADVEGALRTRLEAPGKRKIAERGAEGYIVLQRGAAILALEQCEGVMGVGATTRAAAPFVDAVRPDGPFAAAVGRSVAVKGVSQALPFFGAVSVALHGTAAFAAHYEAMACDKWLKAGAAPKRKVGAGTVVNFLSRRLGVAFVVSHSHALDRPPLVFGDAPSTAEDEDDACFVWLCSPRPEAAGNAAWSGAIAVKQHGALPSVPQLVLKTKRDDSATDTHSGGTERSAATSQAVGGQKAFGGIKQGHAVAPQRWMTHASATIVEVGEEDPEPLAGLPYPTVASGCGLGALLGAGVGTPQLKKNKINFLGGVVMGLALIAQAATLAVYLTDHTHACCNAVGDAAGRGCSWNASSAAADHAFATLPPINGSAVPRAVGDTGHRTCEMEVCRAGGYVNEAAVETVLAKNAHTAYFGAALFLAGLGLLLILSSCFLSFMVVRALAQKAPVAFFWKLLYLFKLLVAVAAVVVAALLLDNLLVALAAPTVVPCADLDDTAARRECLGVQSSCHFELMVHVTAGRGSAEGDVVLGVAAGLVAAAALALLTALLPPFPSEEEQAELLPSVPDLAVFRKGEYCPDGIGAAAIPRLQHGIINELYEPEPPRSRNATPALLTQKALAARERGDGASRGTSAATGESLRGSAQPRGVSPAAAHVHGGKQTVRVTEPEPLVSTRGAFVSTDVAATIERVHTRLAHAPASVEPTPVAVKTVNIGPLPGSINEGGGGADGDLTLQSLPHTRYFVDPGREKTIDGIVSRLRFQEATGGA